jgi:prefoldin subunit 5
MPDNPKIQQLKQQLEAFLQQLDELEPSETSLEDVDRLIEMIESMEMKLK